MIRRIAQASTVLVLLSLAVLAAAWTRQGPFNARVHDHEFSKVILEGGDCVFRYKLYFTAPAERYPADKPQVYRFHARIKLLGGQTVVSPVFNNRAPGSRMYTGSHDTTGQGCWAKQDQKPIGVSVEGCRGKTCTPDPFD